MSNPRKSIKPSNIDCHETGTAIRAISCPATSSITTNCGSFRRVARAMRVAAGMPTSMATAASSAANAGCQWGLIPELSNHQTKTVAAEAQLPGAGPMQAYAEKGSDQLMPKAGRETYSIHLPAVNLSAHVLVGPPSRLLALWASILIPANFVRIERRRVFNTLARVLHG